MRKWMIVLCCMTSLQVWAQYPSYKAVSNTGEFRQQFTKAAQTTNTIQCDFIQTKNLSMMSDKIVSAGKFWYKKENRVRMEYEKPSYYLVVINGNDVKTKNSHRENKASSKSNKMFQQVNNMMVGSMQGTALDNKDFTSVIFENTETYLIELTPTVKSLSAIFKHINLIVNKKDYSVTKLDMLEQSGDNTEISFLHKQMNVSIPDALFSVK